MKLTIHTANERLVVALPQQIVARLGWSSGDVLEAELVRVETANDRTMRTADDVMDEYAWTLEELAKS
jgi:hypothetical protein